MRKILFGTAVAALAAGMLLVPGKAEAWWNRGYGGGGFMLFGPPIVVGPPVYYAPPPVYYSQEPAYPPPPPGQTCYAGPYICPLDRPTPAGADCYCPTNDGRAYGRAR
jgi:hypothetical protein